MIGAMMGKVLLLLLLLVIDMLLVATHLVQTGRFICRPGLLMLSPLLLHAFLFSTLLLCPLKFQLLLFQSLLLLSFLFQTRLFQLSLFFALALLFLIPLALQTLLLFKFLAQFLSCSFVRPAALVFKPLLLAGPTLLLVSAGLFLN